jgi:hypothetical protein
MSNALRQALWWYNNRAGYDDSPEQCPMATHEECRDHLEAVGHSMDEDLHYEWGRAVERWLETQDA